MGTQAHVMSPHSLRLAPTQLEDLQGADPPHERSLRSAASGHFSLNAIAKEITMQAAPARLIAVVLITVLSVSGCATASRDIASALVSPLQY
jgi:hypothetical protein